jgi:hypothetical protein
MWSSDGVPAGRPAHPGRGGGGDPELRDYWALHGNCGLGRPFYFGVDRYHPGGPWRSYPGDRFLTLTPDPDGSSVV